LLPGGFLVLLALLRWRRPEARLLVALSLAPQTMSGYELVPIMAVLPAARWEALLLAALSWASRFGFSHGYPYPDVNAGFIAAGRWSLWLVLIPATLLVLRRPAEAELPDWLAELMSRRMPWQRSRVD
jgi:hypothetical protein